MEWGRESVLKVLVLSRLVSSWCTSTHEASRDLRQIRVYWAKSLQNCEQLMHLHPRGQSRPEANMILLREISPGLWAADAPPPMRSFATWGQNTSYRIVSNWCISTHEVSRDLRQIRFTKKSLQGGEQSWCTSTLEASRDLRQIRVYWEKSLQAGKQLMHLHPRGQSWPEANMGKYEFTERNLSRVVSSWCTSTQEASRDLRQIRVYWERNLSSVVSSWCTSTQEVSRDLRQIRVYCKYLKDW